MGSAAVAAPGCGADGEFPHSAASVAGASGKPCRAGAAAPTMAPAPRLRRRFLRESDMAVLLRERERFPVQGRVGSYLNALQQEIVKVSGHLGASMGHGWMLGRTRGRRRARWPRSGGTKNWRGGTRRVRQLGCARTARNGCAT